MKIQRIVLLPVVIALLAACSSGGSTEVSPRTETATTSAGSSSPQTPTPQAQTPTPTSITSNSPPPVIPAASAVESVGKATGNLDLNQNTGTIVVNVN